MASLRELLKLGICQSSISTLDLILHKKLSSFSVLYDKNVTKSVGFSFQLGWYVFFPPHVKVDIHDWNVQ